MADETVQASPSEEATDGAEEDAGGGSSRDPARCSEHGLVHPEARPWLPKQESEDLAPHPYCIECGEVMGLGKAGGLDKGDLVNLVSRLEDRLEDAGHVVTEAQKRLIFKRIREDDIDDPFGFTRTRQLALVTEIASTYLGIPEEVVHSYLRTA